jgi:hypothetical protein
MTSQKSEDPLEPVLRDAESELKRLLHEACVAEESGVTSDSTAEIRRLEDTLLAAAVAAKQTVALRQHIRERSEAERKETDLRKSDSDPRKNESSSTEEPSHPDTIREFRDAEGRMWRAWPVTPGRARSDSSVGRYLGEYHRGWICFETLDSSMRRRLPREQSNWSELTDDQLEDLLQQAISAPPRKGAAAERATMPLQGGSG